MALIGKYLVYLTFFLLMFIAACAHGADKSEAQTWLEHGAIAGAVVGGVSALAGPTVLAPAALITCGAFVLRELNGPGDLLGYPDNYQGEFSDTDRIMDWAVPCATAGLIWYWRKDKPPIVPWFTPDGVGIGYVGSFD